MMEKMEEKEEKLLTEQRTTKKSEELQQQQRYYGLEKIYRGEDDVVKKKILKEFELFLRALE